MDHYTNEAARASWPDIDEDVPAHALERIAALEKLARDLYHATRSIRAGQAVRVPAGEGWRPDASGVLRPLAADTHGTYRTTDADGYHAIDTASGPIVAAGILPLLAADLERRTCDLLDLDPPGFDPATEGP